MSAWPNLASNETVTHDEVQWAIANNYLAIRPGQTADTGNECISSPQAIGWLLIDSNYMPPLDRGELPVKGNFVPLPASVRVVEDETYSPRIDINLFVSIDDVTLVNPSSTFDQTYSVKGGSVLAAVSQSLEPSTAVNAKKHLRISNDNGVVFDGSNPNLDPNLVWSGRIASGSNWLVEAFGTADAQDGGGTDPGNGTTPPTTGNETLLIQSTWDAPSSGGYQNGSLTMTAIDLTTGSERDTIILPVTADKSFVNWNFKVVPDSNNIRYKLVTNSNFRANTVYFYYSANTSQRAGYLTMSPGQTQYIDLPKAGMVIFL